MKTRNFNEWLSNFKKSINGYGYYTDFNKVYENAERLKVEINILNSLVGARDIERDFEKIITRYPECLKVVPILLAVRSNEIFCQDEAGAFTYSFDVVAQTIDQYKYFMEHTGLFDMLQNRLVNNLYDYVTGVEVGLDSNGRKNRGGHQMENLVEFHLMKAQVDFYKEMLLSEIESKWKLDLSNISADGTSEKRWDFVVKTASCVYAIETNFYTNSGSKLNETARSYKMIAEESKSIKGFEFVWITDGIGWLKSRRNLEETFNVLPNLYNIADLENGLFSSLFREVDA